MHNLELLDTPYQLNQEHIDFYEKNKFIKLKNVFDKETLAVLNTIISEKVNELNTEETPIDERNTYGKAFLQLFNLWLQDDRIKKLVLSKRLGLIATQLMQVDGVRLYHDQALFKEAGGGITPWHADQYYWPLASDKSITAWIPLQATPLEMGPLEFSAMSHQILDGRELSISDESEALIQKRLKVTDFPHVIEPFDAGEISFHSGWVFHRAGANTTPDMRKVMTIIYMDKNMLLQTPENDGQKSDWEKWCPGAEIGSVINSPINPIIYP
ncbi:MAG: phytanoyl-CoA dioxygenase family protein [Salibacteraceae bacterium]|jgi:ectoine hydroxylase-related dioxygenase (phytanoyl-CoA dioxygenase family)|nr:phytanoyl-CoA dioxygenase family protein [Salibacteraceae bacterium]MDP4764343.1 phytanoyl-CoA dioxygenase family protein [Salibacteraceae bacterium]MDP4844722.1 phytanoyl-CoA dioxygenase family protein [Salibacteraceae bacterium]MDP4965863.1 phytanoyl-CoA dioxygenase family protein [Salibacteraceae bacterium]